MIRLYTDGSCHHADKLGAYGAVIVTPTTRKLLWGTQCPTTIARMELTPMIEGLRWVFQQVYNGRPGGEVTILSDSESTVKIAARFNETNKNEDLWSAFRELEAKMKVSYEWRARNSCIPLEICDGVAGALRGYGLEHIYKVMLDTDLQFHSES